MTQSISSAKRSAQAILFALLLVIGMVSGCASDNIHMPEPEDFRPVPDASSSLTFQGKLTTSLPEMPDFEPVIQTDYVRLIWRDADHRRVDIEVGAFHIQVAQMGMDITIGNMLIEAADCTVQDDGSYAFEKAEFACQAGEYFTTGSLSGQYREGEALELTLLYKPGSMPFLCRSAFAGSADEKLN